MATRHSSSHARAASKGTAGKKSRGHGSRPAPQVLVRYDGGVPGRPESIRGELLNANDNGFLVIRQSSNGEEFSIPYARIYVIDHGTSLTDGARAERSAGDDDNVVSIGER